MKCNNNVTGRTPQLLPIYDYVRPCLSTVLGQHQPNTSNNAWREGVGNPDQVRPSVEILNPPGKVHLSSELLSHMQCTECSAMRSIGKLNAKERMEYFCRVTKVDIYCEL